ncbi:hypothetical protein KZ810_02845 [Sphingomonas sp. RHCKR47]|uniref:hypothetical protein n=1 Tax=Sphingomonas citricola TaxID=2862498 RepID=UPI001CA486D4|nr:hypothetical protein [Sphingomonas citricola]MBW6522425.1 hypothetical protein [Sphingomonas citricola]
MGMALHQLPDWPAGMNRETALAYTGVAETQLRAWEKAGKVTFRARGPNGAAVALRVDLDAALAGLFASSANDEDFDFG